jgi:hypothetical protein
MKNSDWLRHKENENLLFYKTRLEQKQFCMQNKIFIYINGLYETPIELSEQNKVVEKKEGEIWLKFNIKCKGGKQIHIKNIKKNYRSVLRSYACFLRALGVDNEHAMLFYMLDFTTYYISFNSGSNFYNWKNNRYEHKEGLKIDFRKTVELMCDVIKWIMKKDVKDIDVSKFIDKRNKKAPQISEACGRLAKSKKIKLIKEYENKELYERIKNLYNPELSNKENCKNIGCSEPILIKWKKKNFESIEEKIVRLYNPMLSKAENCRIINCDKNTLNKYIKKHNLSNIVMEVSEEKIVEENIEIESDIEEKEEEFSDKLDFTNDELLSKIFGNEFFTLFEEEKARWDKFEDNKTFKGFDFL